MISPIYPSAASGWNGTDTINSFAIANGIVGLYQYSATQNVIVVVNVSLLDPKCHLVGCHL